jgi:uncharacterized RDD family membrane protein YckC
MKLNLNLPKEASYKGPASIGKRLVAFVLDLLILDFVIGSPFNSLLSKLSPKISPMETYSYFMSHSRDAMLISLVTIAYGFLALLYFALLEYKTGQTIGKMFMNIKVESEEQNLFLFMVRSMFLLIVFPFILLWLLDPLFMLLSKEKMRLSEILSRTRTVEIYHLNEV